MIDLHSHIIPNLDDGADSFQEAEMIAQDAVDGGTTVMIATPHCFNRHQCLSDNSKEYVTEQFNKLKEHLTQANIPLELCLGAEIFIGNKPEKIFESGDFLTLNNTQYALVEFDFSDSFSRIIDCIDMIYDFHLVPVVAHPERYEFLQNDKQAVYKLLDKGCLLQLNKGSPLGGYGGTVQAFSQWMLRHRLVHLVASDCHSPYRRTANMENAHRWLSLHIDEKYVKLLFEDNPRRIMNGEFASL